MGRGFIAAIFACLILPLAGADVVRLKNGSSFKGKIVALTSKTVVILTNYGKISFSMSQVAHIEKKSTQSISLGSLGGEKLKTPATKQKAQKDLDKPKGVPKKWHSPYVYKGRRDLQGQKLLEKLLKNDWEVIEDLRKLGPKAAVAIPHLLDLLGRNITIWVKNRSSLTLYSINHGPFRLPLTERLLPREAALTLAKIGEVSINALLKVLEDSNAVRRRWALAALGWNDAAKRQNRVAARVAGLLSDPVNDVRVEAIQVLGFLKANAYKNKIARLLLDKNKWIRGQSIETLKLLNKGPKLDPTPLLKALQTRTEWKRRAARAALSRLKGKFLPGIEIEKSLEKEGALRALSSLSPLEKTKRLRKMAKEGGVKSTSALANALTDPSYVVRKEAISLLARVDYPGKEKALERAMKDPNRLVRMEAAACLGKVMGAKAFKVLFKAYTAGRISDRILGLVRTMNRNDPERIENKLVRLAKGGPEKERAAAVYLLGFVTTKGTIDALGKTARWDKSAKVRKTALESLVRLDKSKSTPFLVRALRDRNPSIRKFAYKRLKWITRKDFGPTPGPWELYLRRCAPSPGRRPKAKSQRLFGSPHRTGRNCRPQPVK